MIPFRQTRGGKTSVTQERQVIRTQNRIVYHSRQYVYATQEAWVNTSKPRVAEHRNLRFLNADKEGFDRAIKPIKAVCKLTGHKLLAVPTLMMFKKTILQLV